MTLKFTGDAVILEGGPRDSWAYFVEDIERLVEIERYWGREYPYRPTDRKIVHPRTNGQIESQVWEYYEVGPGQPDKNAGEGAGLAGRRLPSSPASPEPSKLAVICEAIVSAGSRGLTQLELAHATDIGQRHAAPVVAWLMLHGEIVRSVQRAGEQVWRSATAAPDPWEGM